MYSRKEIMKVYRRRSSVSRGLTTLRRVFLSPFVFWRATMAVSKSEKIRRAFVRNPEADVATLVSRFDVSQQLVYGIRKRVLENKEENGEGETTLTNLGEDEPGREGVLDLTVRLTKGTDSVEVRAYGPTGDLKGTIVIEFDGIRYRGPNKKTGKNDRLLKWHLLSHLSASGMIVYKENGHE
jgi:hypothetical protein